VGEPLNAQVGRYFSTSHRRFAGQRVGSMARDVCRLCCYLQLSTSPGSKTPLRHPHFSQVPRTYTLMKLPRLSFSQSVFQITESDLQEV